MLSKEAEELLVKIKRDYVFSNIRFRDYPDYLVKELWEAGYFDKSCSLYFEYEGFDVDVARDGGDQQTVVVKIPPGADIFLEDEIEKAAEYVNEWYGPDFEYCSHSIEYWISDKLREETVFTKMTRTVITYEGENYLKVKNGWKLLEEGEA